MSYKIQYVLAVVVAVVLAGLGAMLAAGPEALGLSATAIAYLGVLSAMLAVVGSLLPKVTLTPENRRARYEAARDKKEMPQDLQ